MWLSGHLPCSSARDLQTVCSTVCLPWKQTDQKTTCRASWFSWRGTSVAPQCVSKLYPPRVKSVLTPLHASAWGACYYSPCCFFGHSWLTHFFCAFYRSYIIQYPSPFSQFRIYMVIFRCGSGLLTNHYHSKFLKHLSQNKSYQHCGKVFICK